MNEKKGKKESAITLLEGRGLLELGAWFCVSSTGFMNLGSAWYGDMYFNIYDVFLSIYIPFCNHFSLS
jgi:hypothetical protein